MNLVRGTEDGTNESIQAMFWINVFALIILIGLIVTLGICIVFMNETVQRCQYFNANPDEENYPDWMSADIHKLNAWFWAFFAVFATVSLSYSLHVAVIADDKRKDADEVAMAERK